VAKSPINVTISGDYNDRDIKKAIRDLQSLEKGAEQSTTTFQKFQKLGGAAQAAIAAGVAVAGTAILQFGKDSLMAASDFDEIQNKVNEIFGESGRMQLNSFAQTAATAMGASATAALDAASQFGIFGKSAGLAGGDLVTFSTDLTLLAGDLASFNNTTTDEAIMALGAGLRGESEPLRRFGVLLDDATLKARAMEMGIYNGSGALSQQQRVLAAQSEILAQTTTQQGDFARTADGLANTMRTVEAAVEDAKVAIGQGLYQAIGDIVGAIGGPQALVYWIRTTANGFGDIIDLLPTLIGLLGDTEDAQKNLAYEQNFSNEGARQFAQLLPIVGTYLVQYLNNAEDSGEATFNLGDGFFYAANGGRTFTGAMGYSASMLDRLYNSATDAAEALDDVNRAAAQAAFEGLDRWSLAQQDAGVRAARLAQETPKVEEAVRRTGSSAGSAAKEVETLALKWRQMSNDVTADVTALAVTINGKTKQISGDLIENFQTKLSAFKTIVSEQTSIIGQAQGALDSYASSVSNTILGKLNFATADATGTPLTPEQIVNLMLGDTAEQQGAVTALANSGLMTQLPEALAQKILNLPATAAVSLVDYLTQNPEALAKLTENYQKLATDSLTLLGIPMANAFAEIGDVSAVAMIADAQKAIAASAKAFRRFVRDQLGTTITIDVKYNYINPPGGTPSIEGRATGGPVSRGTPYVVGERGPELFIPDIGGTIIPNGGGGGGSAPGGGIVVNVNAGMGTDGAQVGQQIVEALRAYQRRNGALPITVAS